MAENPILQYITQKLEKMEQEQVTQAEIRGRILAGLKHLEEEGDEHRNEHVILNQRLAAIELRLNNITLTEAQDTGMQAGIKKSWKMILTVAMSAASLAAWLWEKVLK